MTYLSVYAVSLDEGKRRAERLRRTDVVDSDHRGIDEEADDFFLPLFFFFTGVSSEEALLMEKRDSRKKQSAVLYTKGVKVETNPCKQR